MDYKRREEIFSKEAITLEEFAELMAVSLGTASIKMKEIKRRVGDRLGVQGRIHVADYLAYMELPGESPRYSRPVDETQDKIYRDSICHISRGRQTVNI